MPEIALPHGPLWVAEHGRQESPYPPIIFVHGAGGSHLDWPATLRRMPDAHVFALDLPGHGRSAGPGHQQISAYAAVIVALLDALEIEQAIIGGHSMGGAITQTLALEYADRVAGLILVGTGARLRVHPDILGSILDDPDLVYDTITNWAWGENVPEDMRALGRQRLGTNDPQSVYGDYLACNKFDIMAQVAQIAAPTLVIGGTADRMTPLKYGAYLAEQIGGAELVTVEGGGHMMALEQPDLVGAAVSNWLAAQTW